MNNRRSAVLTDPNLPDSFRLVKTQDAAKVKRHISAMNAAIEIKNATKAFSADKSSKEFKSYWAANVKQEFNKYEAKALGWDESKHPRDEQGRFV